MFVSMPEFQFRVPPGLAAPGAFYARAMSVSTTAAWYVLTLRFGGADPSVETFLMTWDTDVVDAIRTAPAEAKLASLMVMASHRSGSTRGWHSKRIMEIWEATDPSQNNEASVLMVAEDGQEYSGLFMDVATGLKRIRLVARTPIDRRKTKLDA